MTKKYKKPTKLEIVQNYFHKDSDGNIILQYYGTYKNGLTGNEIKNYLRARANKVRVETLYKKFCNIAGCNTMSGYSCPCCDYTTSLMYRHDIERFANVLFGVTKGTYFD